MLFLPLAFSLSISQRYSHVSLYKSTTFFSMAIQLGYLWWDTCRNSEVFQLGLYWLFLCFPVKVRAAEGHPWASVSLSIPVNVSIRWIPRSGITGPKKSTCFPFWQLLPDLQVAALSNYRGDYCIEQIVCATSLPCSLPPKKFVTIYAPTNGEWTYLFPYLVISWVLPFKKRKEKKETLCSSVFLKKFIVLIALPETLMKLNISSCFDWLFVFHLWIACLYSLLNICSSQSVCQSIVGFFKFGGEAQWHLPSVRCYGNY